LREKQQGTNEEIGNKRDKINSSDKNEKVMLLFWNIAEVERKKRGFWEYVTSSDFVGLIETRIEREKMGVLEEKKKLPKGFIWTYWVAKRKKRKGSASSGTMTGVKGEWEIITENNEIY
jgi:hypothetical protein